ncbi:MAG: hypothetical protein OEY87_01950 [Gammaproteobacteria bacterium]|nr:hypothetical protein [Gammaproteobacteria bacterium]
MKKGRRFLAMVNNINKLLVFISVILTLTSQSALAFPTGGGTTCFFCAPYSFGGSVITFDLTSSDKNDLAPITFNFLEEPTTPGVGRLCLSGKINATITHNGLSGEATYELLGSDGSNRGVCYQNVTQTCADTGADLGTSCGAEKCTYTVPALGNIQDLSKLLDGRFMVDTSLPATGLYADCLTDPTINRCDFEVGFSFDNGVPVNFFPATQTLNAESVDANVVLYATEVCIECQPTGLGLNPATAAIRSKTEVIRACEALAIKTDWCSDLQSSIGPACQTTNAEGQLTIGGMNTAIGDFQVQETSTAVCANSISDLQSLTSCPQEIAIAGCGDGPGYVTFPATYEQTTCSADGSDVEIFTFSSAQGGGSNTVNMAAIGANPDAPGYMGDNTLPPIYPTYTAVVSTPDNQVNVWDFSATDLYKVAYIHARNNDDIVTGSKGPDNILGGSGADILNGHDDNDILQGGDNADQLNGNNGNDLLLGYECTGSNANCSSFLNNGSDNDVLNGGNGNDCLDGGRGNDTLTGGAGSDAFVLFGNTDSDTFTDFNVAEDVIVDLVGSASANWVQAKKDIPSACEVSVGGNNTITMTGIDSKNTCLAINIVTTLPAQCSGHPASF